MNTTPRIPRTVIDLTAVEEPPTLQEEVDDLTRRIAIMERALLVAQANITSMNRVIQYLLSGYDTE
jgi:hypothetical protein